MGLLGRVDRALRVGADDLDLRVALLQVAAAPEIVPPVPTEITSASISPPVCSQISGPVVS